MITDAAISGLAQVDFEQVDHRLIAGAVFVAGAFGIRYVEKRSEALYGVKRRHFPSDVRQKKRSRWG